MKGDRQVEAYDRLTRKCVSAMPKSDLTRAAFLAGIWPDFICWRFYRRFLSRQGAFAIDEYGRSGLSLISLYFFFGVPDTHGGARGPLGVPAVTQIRLLAVP